jgi:hypothetical protein
MVWVRAVAALPVFGVINSITPQVINLNILLRGNQIQCYLVACLYTANIGHQYFRVLFGMYGRKRGLHQFGIWRSLTDNFNKIGQRFFVFFLSITKAVQAIIKMYNIKFIIAHYQGHFLQYGRVANTF